MLAMALIGALIERVALRPMVGQPPSPPRWSRSGLFFALHVVAATG
jgi:branched-subunit amino acid ABC-type transport system permease component